MQHPGSAGPSGKSAQSVSADQLTKGRTGWRKVVSGKRKVVSGKERKSCM
jgi:hypothetical protein